MESDTELINSCRVCRASNQDGDFESLFVAEGVAILAGTWLLTPAGKLYEELLGVKIEAASRHFYPRYLCNSCELQMKLFKKLKTKADKTLYDLRKKMPAIKQDAIKVAQDIVGECDKNLSKQQPTRRMHIEKSCNDTDVTAIKQKAKAVPDEFVIKCDKHLSVQPKQLKVLQETTVITQGEEVLTGIEENLAEIYHGVVNREVKSSDIYEEESFVDFDDIELADAQVVVEEEQEEDEEQTSVPYMTETYEIVSDFDTNEEDSGSDTKPIHSNESSETRDAAGGIAADTNSTSSTKDNNVDFLDVNYLDDLPEEYNSRVPPIKRVSKRNRENNFKCFLCDMEFTERLEFVAHRKVMHDSKYPCPECPKLFRTSDALRVHSKLHGGEAPYKCDLCEKTFNQKVHYRYHMDRHNNVRNFKCEQCGKAFLSKADLSVHARIHAGDRRYGCEICGKDFLMLQHLKMHQYSHSNKSFACEICQQKFISPTTLRTHMLTIHENTPQFECEICVKRFRRKHHLMAHYKVHSKPKIDRCRLKQQKAIFEFMEIMEAEQMEEISVVDDEQSQIYDEHLQQNSSDFSL